MRAIDRNKRLLSKQMLAWLFCLYTLMLVGTLHAHEKDFSYFDTTYYKNGWEAYQQGDWIRTIENIYLYWQVVGIYKSVEFQQELRSAVRYAEMQLGQEKDHLRKELKLCLNMYKKYCGVYTFGKAEEEYIPKPHLRRVPPPTQ